MRVVVDTNVLVSGILSPHGPPGRILAAILAERVAVLYDDRIVDEYRAVLLRPVFGFHQADVDTLVDFIERAGEYVSATPVSVDLPDRSDLPFLEVAMAGNADALVTGNSKHFRPRLGRHGVSIVSPREFVRHVPA